MAFPILMAAKAGALAKTAGSVLAEWNRLPPDAKARVRREASDVTRSLDELRRALGARLFSSEAEISWEDARSLALDPSPEFELAKSIVETVRTAGEIEESELRSKLSGAELPRFEQAIAIASEDEYIEPVGAGRWRITEFGDLQLVESEEVAFVERSVVEHVQGLGLAGRDELALAVGVPEFHSPTFVAAVERALAAGAIEWLGPSLYGLPRETLAETAPPQPEPDERADGRKLRAVLLDLAREIAELRAAVSRERGGQETGSPAQRYASSTETRSALPGLTISSASDPVDRLRRLKELADEGLLTAEEFARKRAEILGEM